MKIYDGRGRVDIRGLDMFSRSAINHMNYRAWETKHRIAQQAVDISRHSACEKAPGHSAVGCS